MKYLLKTGEIVEASDTQWITNDALWEFKNGKLLEKRNLDEFGTQEVLRLQYKYSYMRDHGIEQIIE
jgi:hypothetical protein